MIVRAGALVGGELRVFISWSKAVSRELAIVLRDWLPDVIQELKPWMSNEDIEKGARWAVEIGAQLEHHDQGILCITTENQQEPWLNFEAGALAKSLDEGRVRPVLLGLAKSDVVGPLAQFQATIADDRDDMSKFIRSLNGGCTDSIDVVRLTRSFDRTWDDYVGRIRQIQTFSTVSTVEDGRRPTDEVVSEILDRVRELQRSFRADNPRRNFGLDFELKLNDGTALRRGDRVHHPEHGIGILDRAGLRHPGRVGVRFGGSGRVVRVEDLMPHPAELPPPADGYLDGLQVIEADIAEQERGV